MRPVTERIRYRVYPAPELADRQQPAAASTAPSGSTSASKPPAAARSAPVRVPVPPAQRPPPDDGGTSPAPDASRACAARAGSPYREADRCEPPDQAIAAAARSAHAPPLPAALGQAPAWAGLAHPRSAAEL